MSASESSPSLQSELDAVSSTIPGEIDDRIRTGAQAIAASGSAEGLHVGERAPDFSLPDALGHVISLSTLRAHGPVVVTFYRGEWCPFCNMQLRALQRAVPRFRALGATLVAISPQSPDHSLSLTQKHDLDFAVLSDLDQSVMRAYRVQFQLSGDLEDLQVNVFRNDPALQNADHSRSLPVPSTFVIDRDGVVRAAFVNPDWRTRVEPADVEAVLASLS